MYAADLIVTVVIAAADVAVVPTIRARRCSRRDELRAALRFGLPRVPHGIAQQTLDGGNKLLLGAFIPQAQLGVYQNAVTLGTGVKFFTSAFETAWAPFYYATSRQPDAKDIFSR